MKTVLTWGIQGVAVFFVLYSVFTLVAGIVAHVGSIPALTR